MDRLDSSAAMRCLEVSSDRFPADLDERGRLSHWLEMSEAFYASRDLNNADDKPFFVRLSVSRVGPILLDEYESTLTRHARSARHIAADGTDDFCLGLNCGGRPLVQKQLRREVVHDPGSFGLHSFAEPGELYSHPLNRWQSIKLPGARLRALVADAEDLVARPLDRDLPAARHLTRYMALLFEPGGLAESDPGLDEHIAETLTDLTALVLGAGREAAELAGTRGLRAAQLKLLLAEIKQRFADPAISPESVARRLCLSPRYVQDLLHGTGRSLTERVLELRLQKARQMLADPRYDKWKVIEIADGCGFNDLSYFNRCFRRRFGATPTSLRGRRV
ncbi:AraC family transcriptional regulator [Mesorhizobium sp. 1B3]|uniref:helix-turn-helix transcriptional regulator n=1 Tax=Mesorhizobium sp. 1B3 TaxID=3243599 RepID=UPI003D97D6CC